MYEKILVPLDGSIMAENVLPFVEGISKRLGSEVILISVFPEDKKALDRPLRAYIEKRVSELQALGVKANGMVVYGEDPAEEILALSEKINAGLIALSAYGASGTKWRMGGVPSKILQGTRRPLLLTRTLSFEEAIKQREFQRVLVPLDGSKAAEEILSYLEAFLKGSDSEILLLHVLEPIKLPPYVESIIEASMEPEERENWKEQKEKERFQEAQNYLKEIGDTLRERGFKAREIVKIGEIAETILSTISEEKCDLLAISSHGKQSGLTRWLFGDVAFKLIEGSVIPLFILPRRKGLLFAEYH
jgi:nucleotide-binding universal stress UspA family protein